MKILNTIQIREWDNTTIQKHSSSLQLMEQASEAFVYQFMTVLPSRKNEVYVFCGPGNNGGDGLAIVRLLLNGGYKARAVCRSKTGSEDYLANFRRLEEENPDAVVLIRDKNDFPDVPESAVCVDALFGTGLSRPIEGEWAKWVEKMNTRTAPVLSVDIPSGLYADKRTPEDSPVVRANYTFTFGCAKLAFLLCQSQKYTGKWRVLDIGLNKEYLSEIKSSYSTIDRAQATRIFPEREKCSHKGTFGHALIWAGSVGKIGAALMSAKSCLRSGAGLVTTYIPKCGYTVMQSMLPEAMTLTGEEEKLSAFPDLQPYKAIGLGPGIGKAKDTAEAIHKFLQKNTVPAVIDADALNILSDNQEWLGLLDENYILTPHPKEFERLTGKAQDDWERLDKAKVFVEKYKCVLVLKSAFTSVHLPDGTTWFNTTGNPGMATGGTGDVLAGLLTGLLAQGYSPAEAAIGGVWWHGKAGDLAAAKYGQVSMLAGDLIDSLAEVSASFSHTPVI